MSRPTLEAIRSDLHYEPETGVFKRLKANARCVKVGDIAGSNDGNGYVRIGVQSSQQRAHRLAWVYMTGAWPVHAIDHINGNRSDNRWVNLRQATNAENRQNMRNPGSLNTSGFLGVSWDKQMCKWIAKIKKDRKITHIGFFPTAEEAHVAYLEKKRKFHPFCTI